MAREKKRTRTRRLHPEDVLAGRVKVDALELYRLIHRVNPTNRFLSRKEAERRYDQKHKLQSFLVLNFGDDHVVVSRSEKPGVVRFDHPSGVFDACHAPLAELDPEARSWIQLRLDTKDDGEDERLVLPTPVDDGADEAPEDALADARRALAEFDYATAERLLTRAFDGGRGDVPLVVELLALKVEILGLDEEALAVVPRLGDAALADADVRSLLALAAARRGRGELADKLLGGLGTPRAATPQARVAAAYAARAAGAAGDGDEEAARRWLAELVACDPFHEGIAAVNAGLERLAESGRREAEAELTELYRQRGPLEAADAARTLADRWPTSEVARRILREAGDLRRTTAIAEHLEIADQALTDREFDTAVRHYEAVLEQDADAPGVPRRLEQARRGARERAAEVAVGGVERQFAEGDSRRALLAYLELPRGLRDRVRARLEEEAASATRDLDAVEAAHPKLKAAAMVDAVVTLRDAERLFAEDRAQEAWLAFEPLREVLAAVPRTSSLQKEIAGRVVEELAKENVERIRQVKASFHADSTIPELRENLELLSQIDPHFLTPEYRRWVEVTEFSMRRAIELQNLVLACKSEIEAGQLFAARRSLRQYQELMKSTAPEVDVEAFRSRERSLDEEIKEVWQLRHESWRRGRPLPPYPGILQPRPGHDWKSESRGIDDEGRRLVVAQALVDWLFVSVIDLSSGKLLERLSMATPKPLGAPLSTCWDGDAIRIGGGEGGVVVLEPNDWRVAEWHWLPDHLRGDRIKRTVVLPRSPYAWVFSRDHHDNVSKVRVVAQDTWTVVRKRSKVFTMSVVCGPGPDGADEGPRVVLADKNGTSLFTAHGRRDPDQALVDRFALAAAGDGTAIVALLTPPGDVEATLGPPSSGGRGLGLARFEPGEGGWRLAREVLVAAAVTLQQPVMVAAGGVVWTLFEGTDGETWLLAVEGKTLEALYCLRVPHASALAGDRHGRHAALLLDGERGPETARLGRHEPRLRWKWRPPAERRLPVLDLHVSCMTRAGKGREALKKFDALPPSQRKEHVLAMARESTAENLEEVILQAYVLHSRDEALTRKFLAELRSRHPENLDVVFLLGEWQCRLASGTRRVEDWQQALDMVHATDPEWMTVYRRHFHHVQGVGYLVAGRQEEARQAFEAGLRHDDGGCDLEPLLELAKPMNRKPKKSEWDARQPLTRQLVGAFLAGSEAISRNDDKAAIAALERPAVWLATESETLLRLALAHLELTREPEDASFELRIGLSLLLEVIKVQGPRRLPSGELQAAAENLEQMGDSVRKWFDLATMPIEEDEEHPEPR